jgi:outer membrane protein assembly factor BamB
VNAIFGGAQIVHRSLKATCGLLNSPCWKDDPTYTDGSTGSTAVLPFTPVFDGSTIWTADSAGVVYIWAQDTGKLLNSRGLGAAVSSPVLLQGGAALIVHHDGSVQILTPAATATLTSLTLVNVSANVVPFPLTPVPPAIDVRASGGVAYVPAPQGWVYALQIPQAPMPAGPAVWPRPGHDSCNSRNASTSNTVCP